MARDPALDWDQGMSISRLLSLASENHRRNYLDLCRQLGIDTVGDPGPAPDTTHELRYYADTRLGRRILMLEKRLSAKRRKELGLDRVL